jgi:hypothetical protein
MSKTFALTFLFGLLVVGAAIWVLFIKQEGAHIEPKGSILKVRTLKLDDEHSAAIVEVRLLNNADYAVVARSIEVSAVAGSGEVQGNVAAEMDVKNLFKYYPALGEQFNPVLKARDQVPPRSSIDREVCATFALPIDQLDSRKDLIVRVEDITGPTAEMHEKRR